MNHSMNEKLMARLQQATLLTRGGHLHQATTLIQQALRGEQQPNNQRAQSKEDEFAAAQGEPFEGCFQTIEEPAVSKTYHQRAAQPPNKKDSASFTVPGVRESLRTQWLSLSGIGSKTPSLPTGMEELLGGQLTGLRSQNAASLAIVPEGATFCGATFTNHVGSRDYKLYVPSAYHGQPLPLIVMLHGCTQNPDDFAVGTGMNSLAEEQPCLVLYPAQHSGANHSRCWNWFKASDQHREGGEPEIIAGMTRQIIQDYGIDENRVYVAGLSAGGAMATTMANTYPELYAAVGVHSGLAHGIAQDLPSALAAMQGSTGPLAGLNQQKNKPITASNVPAIIFHGDQDTTVHPSNAAQVAAQHLAAKQGANKRLKTQQHSATVPHGHAYTCQLYRDSSDQVILEQWTIHGAGHAWAGGDALGSYTDPQGPNASREMLRFFLSHSKSTH